MKNIVIFGSGQFGHDALMFMGNENIHCFCDNNPLFSGIIKYGKPIISFDELKEKYRDEIVLIAVSGVNAYDIARQCEENGILDYLIYTFLRETVSDFSQMQLLDFINDPHNRMKLRKDIYYKRMLELERQVEYFKTHTDIRYMKPAQGELRRRQLRSVQVSSDFFKKIGELEIRPILYGGNLLGYVRHNGFIPWDDDIDFALMRDEYEKLKEYCRLHIYTEREWDEKELGEETVEKEVIPAMASYYWVLQKDHFLIMEVLDDNYCVGMDFFPLEYYADHYSLTELRELADGLRADWISMDSEEDKIRYAEQVRITNRQNTVQKSEGIYFGVESTEMRHSYHRDHFIPRDVMFPLKKVMWEGAYFWVPNQAEEFLTYEYEHPWDFPCDVGVPLHLKMDGEDI